MTEDKKNDETSEGDARSREDRSDPCGARRARRHRGSGRYGRRKERVLHTRVSEQLSDDIRQLADDLRVPVSNLVRNVLEEVFTVVENVTDDVGEFFEDVVEEADGIRERIRNQERAPSQSARGGRRSRRGGRGRGSRPSSRDSDAADIEKELRSDEAAEGPSTRSPEPQPAKTANLDDVLGWQPIVLNRSIRCGRCDTELASGANAMMGISQSGQPSQVVCPGCAGRD